MNRPARKPDHSRFWYDFGRYNLTGWSIVLPTLGGIALGYWLDQNHPSSFSWTITLMVAGLTLGCLNAWYWISRTNRKKEKGGKKTGLDGKRGKR
ncbi:MAG: AtpZ/AtpI family protein [Thermoleophilia bacterium]